MAVNGRPVTARQAGDETLIPLPGGADPNAPVEVSLRLGKPALDKRHASLVLPTVFAPVLKTQWNVKAGREPCAHTERWNRRANDSNRLAQRL